MFQGSVIELEIQNQLSQIQVNQMKKKLNFLATRSRTCSPHQKQRLQKH
jgi:hypothetical protein